MPGGRKIDVFTMTIDDIDYKDFILCLPNICRWGARIEKHYSVGQHVLELYWYLKSIGRPDLAKMGLFHDGCEAYIGDIIYPIKTEIPIFQELEDKLCNLVYEKYNIDKSLIKEFDYYDRQISRNEAIGIGLFDEIKDEPAIKNLVGLPDLTITPMSSISIVRSLLRAAMEQELSR